MLKITSFADPARVVYTGSQGIEILPGLENHGLTHENRQKWPKTRVLPMPLKSCTGGHRASKSSRDPKIMGYNPRKRLEMAENTSFADPARVVYRGSHSIKFRPGLEKHGLKPTKTTRICRKHKFSRSVKSRVPGVTGHRNPPGTRKSWVITHENRKKWNKT